jgi:hypothetical protein
MDKCQIQQLYYFEQYKNNPNMYLWCIKLSTISEQKNNFHMVGFFYAIGQLPLFPSYIFVFHRCLYGCESVYSTLIYITLIQWWTILVMMTWFNPIHNFIWLKLFMSWSLFPTIMSSVGWFSFFCENHRFRFLRQLLKITPIILLLKNSHFENCLGFQISKKI